MPSAGACFWCLDHFREQPVWTVVGTSGIIFSRASIGCHPQDLCASLQDRHMMPQERNPSEWLKEKLKANLPLRKDTGELLPMVSWFLTLSDNLPAHQSGSSPIDLQFLRNPWPIGGSTISSPLVLYFPGRPSSCEVLSRE